MKRRGVQPRRFDGCLAACGGALTFWACGYEAIAVLYTFMDKIRDRHGYLWLSLGTAQVYILLRWAWSIPNLGMREKIWLRLSDD